MTIKTASVGRPTRVTAGMQVTGSNWSYDVGDYRYYAGPVKLRGRGKCVRYFGYHGGQNYASPWGNCGDVTGVDSAAPRGRVDPFGSNCLGRATEDEARDAADKPAVARRGGAIGNAVGSSARSLARREAVRMSRPLAAWRGRRTSTAAG